MTHRERQPLTAGPRGLPGTLALLVVAAGLLSLMSGCGTTAPTPETPATTDTVAAARPAMTLSIGAIDVSTYRGRVEKKQVEELAALISKHRVEVVALQGLTRYPGVSTRTDLLDALGAATGMRTSFGETIAVSGRQTGNAVLSAYPIVSSDSRPYDGITGTGFEGALRAIVDAGTRPVVVVSTRLPNPLSGEDLRICTGTIDGISAEHPDDPVIVLGNLPPPPAGTAWETTGENTAGRAFAWFKARGMAVRDAGAVARCELGNLRLSQVDLYPRGRP